MLMIGIEQLLILYTKYGIWIVLDFNASDGPSWSVNRNIIVNTI